ncbi:hypothetical protein [Flammeovirga kamogawensis]|uniref:Beta-ketoacyl-[acyl-carrier-protein] synthase III N-terminal domain-containing protein n=1 Tax=Flammeovirga kamogawensis TaxID=373891 RepID=A0ABX8H4S2_9BACT|nr:hypothetical protein [Flammeovirga kamogawensis]MBB6461787.1 3-oxoacyl-[acyl-carrier-protein] synthase-3 [Flammeovirga kamogawensis]QWG10703.1 hypothetical protein KM029_25300 [Flammeovirga kamogawensis]TRX63805.1 hypothetical protein EO216_25670 [Flammeovirga kamogawensis]
MNPRIIGQGYSVPTKIRYNDDPIFDTIKGDNGLFKGYKERRVLLNDESISEHMVVACNKALQNANICSDAIDYFIGYGSISTYRAPNIMAKCHAELSLPSNCTILPINNEFNQVNIAIMLASNLISSGEAETILIGVGSNWTKHVDYTSSACVSASDAAAALVVSKSNDSTLFKYIDSVSITDTNDYGSMFSSSDVIGTKKLNQPILSDINLYTSPYFHLTEQGVNVFKEFGMNKPIEAVTNLLQRNNLTASQITLISHQASSVLMDFWENGNDQIKGIEPNQYINTIQEYANMTLATVAFNLAFKLSEIINNHLVLLTVGLDQQTTALLLTRNT